MNDAYERGDLASVANILRQEFGACVRAADKAAVRYRSFTRRIPVTVRNPLELFRENEPVSVPTEAIFEADRDFNPDCCTLVAPERRIAWHPIPFQIDPAGSAQAQELFFVAHLRPQETATYYLYYAPQETEPRAFATRTAAAMAWLPENVGWESDRVGYRAYRGQFDFFGKKQQTLVVKTFRDDTYHAEQPWGMDALNVGKTSGLGGLTLFVNGAAYPVQNPDGTGSVRFRNEILFEGPLRTTVEMVASEIGEAKKEFNVRIRCSAIAGRKDTDVRVTVVPAKPASEILIAPGFTRLSDEDFFLDTHLGFFGSWGRQTPTIGDIGMALIFPPEHYHGFVEEEAERKVVLSLPASGEIRYLLIGDWRRGRRFPYAPTMDNWREKVRRIAVRYHNPLTWAVGAAESVR
jgi:hypothetical protein